MGCVSNFTEEWLRKNQRPLQLFQREAGASTLSDVVFNALSEVVIRNEAAECGWRHSLAP